MALPTLDSLTRWAATDSGRQALGLGSQQDGVTLTPLGTAVLATIGCGSAARRVVLKTAAGQTHITDAADLHRVHERLRSRSPGLRESLAGILAVNPGCNLMVLEHIPGPTLRDLLLRAPRQPGHPGHPGRANLDSLLEETGRRFARVHAVPGPQVGLPGLPAANAQYLPTLRALWEQPAVQRALPADRRDFATFMKSLPADFAQRSADRVLLVDCQPKNVLIDAQGGPRFIDPDYCLGNPALGLAQFLTGLDRLGLRRPTAGRLARIAAWRQALLRGYAEVSDARTLADLRFFYPWMLARLAVEHPRRKPLWGRYLAWYWGRMLRASGDWLDSTLPTTVPAERRAA